MAIPTILKGDATNANGRTVAIHLPDVDLDGFALRFEYLGIAREFDGLTRGGTVYADFSESETAMFPLGTHFGTLRLGRAGKWHTVSATVPVKVSDNVGEVYGGDAANINLAIDFCGGIPDLSGIDSEPTTANALARAFKALLDALKGAAGTVALLACMAVFGAPRMTVHSAPLGEVAFGNRVVTDVEFDESGLVTGDDIADVVREDYLKSMSWTNANFSSSVHAAIPRVVNSINGATGDVTVTANSIGAIPTRDLYTYASMGPDGLEFSGVGTYGGFIRLGDWLEYEIPTVSVQDGFGRGVFVGYSGRASSHPDVRILYGNYGYNTRPYEISLFDTYERVVALSNALASASGGADAFYDWKTNDTRVVLGDESEATGDKSIAIGLPYLNGTKASASGTRSLAVGVAARATGAESLALGANARSFATSAVQIGDGQNTTAGTIQYKNFRLLNADGTIPAERFGAVVTAETVTNAVERVRDLIYDEQLGVTWRRVMHGGNLYFVAVTNANMLVEGN